MAQTLVRLLALAQVPVESVVEAMNAAYADYYVPVHLTSHNFQELVVREDIRLDSSVAASADGRIVGLGLLGVRGERAWIGGVGIIPACRHQGIGRRMMLSLIEAARGQRASRVQLEVITRNAAAHTLYRSLGFYDRRRLSILYANHGPAGAPGSTAEPAPSVADANPEMLLEALPRFAAGERPWQHDLGAMRVVLDRIDGLAARDSLGELVGACLWSGDGAQAGLLALAGRSTQVGVRLLAGLRARLPAARLAYINVPDDDPMLPALLDTGFSEALAQHEMLLDLSEETR